MLLLLQVETHDKAISEADLLAKIPEVHAVGVRSKTSLSAQVIAAGKKLLTIGAFCIGTDQTDLDAASLNGTAVFNAPFANTRSVAELVLGEMIMLARQVVDRCAECHAHKWNKSSAGCVEVRGKTLAIIGYGHVGSQLSVLAEALGLHVQFYDVVPKLPLGNAVAKESLEAAIRTADFLSLHVPAEAGTTNLIGAREIAWLPKGSFLLNASRGSVVDIDAAAAALRSGHLSGAAFDVYPEEPSAAGDPFLTPLQGCKNTILTPHVGGSTEEAQVAIGKEVAQKMISYINSGITLGSVNLPEVSLVKAPTSHRILNIHRNVPGVLKEVNHQLEEFNINAQMLQTRGPIGYMIIDGQCHAVCLARGPACCSAAAWRRLRRD
jgi:D-3-phosphoglycerate dehydrogenase